MIAQQVAQDEQEAAQARQRAAEAAEAARVARAAMVAQGAEQLRQSADTELARLKAAMVAAHPDRGGDAAHFIAALHAWRAARR
jgi:hypothetical protein